MAGCGNDTHKWVVKTANGVPVPGSGAWYVIATGQLETDADILAELNTQKSCEPKDRLITPECVKKRTFKVGYDNGTTPSSVTNDCGERINLIRFNQDFDVLGWMVNGVEWGAGEVLGGFANWTAQLQGWAAFFNQFDPNPNSTAAFGFKPAPTWRFTEITGCDPTAVYGPLRLKRQSDGCLFTVYPVQTLASDETVMLQRHAAVDCDDVKKTVWCAVDDQPLAEPPTQIGCFVPCAFPYSPYLDVGDAPACTEVVKDLCDVVDGQSVAEFVLVITTCDGVRTRERWTANSYATAANFDELVPYEVQGIVSNCDTLEPYVEPPIEGEKCELRERPICLKLGDVVLNAYAVLVVSESGTEKIRYEDGFGNVVEGVPTQCTCDAVDFIEALDPIGDQVVCASRKLGADIESTATGNAVHTAGSLFDTNGPVVAWSGTFTVTDSAGTTHTMSDGQTITGLASGSTQQVTFTGTVEWTDGTATYRCPVTDKPISANFVVQ